MLDTAANREFSRLQAFEGTAETRMPLRGFGRTKTSNPSESRLRLFLAQRLGPSFTTGNSVELNSSQAHLWAFHIPALAMVRPATISRVRP